MDENWPARVLGRRHRAGLSAAAGQRRSRAANGTPEWQQLLHCGPVSAHSLRRGRRPGRVVCGCLLAGVSLLLAACSAPASTGTFHPAGGATSSTPTTSPTPGASTLGAYGLEWPPFGSNVRIEMPDYRPADKALRPAVIAAEDFLLALLYSDYVGGRDTRWEGYVYGQERSRLAADLADPDVTTESYVGTYRVWGMFASSFSSGEVEVADCVDSAGTKNTDLATGTILPASEQFTTDENYYYNADVLANVHGHWRVVSIEPPIYYPSAAECMP
jgi:hypothetical protein